MKKSRIKTDGSRRYARNRNTSCTSGFEAVGMTKRHASLTGHKKELEQLLTWGREHPSDCLMRDVWGIGHGPVSVCTTTLYSPSWARNLSTSSM